MQDAQFYCPGKKYFQNTKNDFNVYQIIKAVLHIFRPAGKKNKPVLIATTRQAERSGFIKIFESLT